MQKQDKEYSKQIGSRIMEARRDFGLTQAQLAAACNVDEKTIQAIERGRRRASYELLCAISSELNVLVDFFLKDGPRVSTTYITKEYADRISQMNTRTQQTGLDIMDSLLDLQKKTENFQVE